MTMGTASDPDPASGSSPTLLRRTLGGSDDLDRLVERTCRGADTACRVADPAIRLSGYLDTMNESLYGAASPAGDGSTLRDGNEYDAEFAPLRQAFVAAVRSELVGA
ncbi:MAG TPA: hypothetical protein VEZ42_22165 [Pseudonocardia sp.]|nr:hypothetical protein [Pseudonocardia sp.]